MAALPVHQSSALLDMVAGGGMFNPKIGIETIGRYMLNYSKDESLQESLQIVFTCLREQNLTLEAKNNLERVLTKFTGQLNEGSKRENYAIFVNILSETSNFVYSSDQQKLEQKLGKISMVIQLAAEERGDILSCGCLRNCAFRCGK